MILALLKYLPALMPGCKFLLLTSGRSHDELAFLDRPNLSRLCVHQSEPERSVEPSTPSARGRLNADLLFCPFTAPIYWEPFIRTVSIVYDIQYVDYPQFFAPEDLCQRAQNFQDTIQKADHLITISDFVRSTVLNQQGVRPSQITTVHIGHVQDFSPLEQTEKIGLLKRIGVKPGCYLLYPANLWRHKNHAMLLTAFRIFLESHPGTELKLVCTGALESPRAELMRAAQLMGMEERVVFPGFLPSAEIGVLYQHALALIFPSLYEGFGIPLLEAFAAGVPVLCSNVTSLPEVGGEAVLYFNPGKPQEIADTIDKITSDQSLRRELVERGQQRLVYFGGAERMAREYAILLQRVLETQPDHTHFQLIGVENDGWLQERAYLLKPQTIEKAELVIRLGLPSWVPQALQVEAYWGSQELGRWKLSPGGEHVLALSAPPESGCVSLSFAPGVSPANLGMGTDARLLSAQYLACTIKAEVAPEIRTVV